ncbi:DUF6473 family protein [Pseudogemmobacter sonorensis]|uniref:DUF6473 family protein n=1 Tax=Pseudogemmobacter sonorensis TaxID=2989681 RepID=UPI0036BD7376
MSLLRTGAKALDHSPCRYGGSRLAFRGPERDLDGDYIVVLGGSESCGRGGAEPFAERIGRESGLGVANLSCANAGPDVWLADRRLESVIRGAHLGIVQLVGAVNLSNDFYRVHPRRNDRFLAARPRLRALYPEVDFSEVNFTGHLMKVLGRRGPERFAPVLAELKSVWLARMSRVLEMLPRRRLLLWAGIAPPPLDSSPGDPSADPALVDRAMVEALAGRAGAQVEYLTDPGAGRPVDPESAGGSLEEGFHRMAAARLLPVIGRMV